MADTKRYLLLRVPNTGPKALAGPPNDFATHEQAQARLDEIMEKHLKTHHTHLEIAEYQGDKFRYMDASGILY